MILYDFDWAEESSCVFRNKRTGNELRLGTDERCDDIPDNIDEWAPVEAQVWYSSCNEGRTHDGRTLAESYLNGGEIKGCTCDVSDWEVAYRMIEEIEGRVWVVVPDADEAYFIGRNETLKLLGLSNTPYPNRAEGPKGDER